METKIYYKDNNAPYAEITSLLHEAFEEHLKVGLNFGCATYSIEDFKQHTMDAYIFAMYEDNKIIATVSLRPRYKWGGVKIADHEYLAVSNSCKGKGVASKLFSEVLEFCLNNEVVCLFSTTAETAYNSIGYHKKNGFCIFKMDSFSRTNYYSWVFIRPITRFKFFKCPFIRLPLLYASIIKCKLTKRKDGSSRFK